jgi:hypothetical protein
MVFCALTLRIWQALSQLKLDMSAPLGWLTVGGVCLHEASQSCHVHVHWLIKDQPRMSRAKSRMCAGNARQALLPHILPTSSMAHAWYGSTDHDDRPEQHLTTLSAGINAADANLPEICFQILQTCSSRVHFADC